MIKFALRVFFHIHPNKLKIIKIVWNERKNIFSDDQDKKRFLEILSETKNLLLNVVQLVKADMNLLDSFTTGSDRMIEEEVLD